LLLNRWFSLFKARYLLKFCQSSYGYVKIDKFTRLQPGLKLRFKSRDVIDHISTIW